MQTQLATNNTKKVTYLQRLAALAAKRDPYSTCLVGWAMVGGFATLFYLCG